MHPTSHPSAFQHLRGIACAVLWGAVEFVALARSRRSSSASRLHLPRH